MNRIASKVLISLALTTLALPLCAQETATAKQPAPQGKQLVNRIAATVNGRPITSSEVRMRMGPYVRELMMMHPQQGAEFTNELIKVKKNIISELIDRELVLSEFDTQGYMIPEQRIDEELNDRILRRFQGKRADFLEMLRKSGMSYSDYKESIRKELSVSALRSQRYEQGIPPTPDELQKEYQLTKRDYRDVTQDRVTYDKIFLPMVTDGSAGSAQEQYAGALALAAAIKNGEIDFADAAKKYSKDLHAAEGGRWPATKRVDLAADFAGIIFNAKPQSILGPLYDPAGFTIVRTISVREAAAPSMSDPKIKLMIDASARRRQSEQRYREWVTRLRDQAIIRTFI